MATNPSGKKPAPKRATPKPATPKKPDPKSKGAGIRAPAVKSAPPSVRKSPPTRKAKPSPTKSATRRTIVKAKPSSPVKAKKPAPGAKAGQIKTKLTAKEQSFVDEYMIDLNGTQAAIRAKYSQNSAAEIACENLRKPHIQAAIASARKAQQERTQVTADRWLLEVAAIALADSRELVEVRSGCCRCCHGENNKYQRTVGEMNRDREAWAEKGKNPAEFDEAGGIGFNPLMPPSDECPVCGGDGMARAVLRDTRYLSPAAVALYAGAKQTQYGIEIKMHSKTDALEKLARHLGVYEKDNAQKIDPLAALLDRMSSGNNNGFKPVQVDPERPASSIGPKSMPADDEEED